MGFRHTIKGKLSAFAVASGLGLVLATTANAQDLIPTTRWDAESGNWTADANWATLGTNPVLNEAPTDANVASIRNGGTATLNSAATVQGLSVLDGTLDITDGGALTVNDAATIGGTGVISFNGGTLTSGAFDISGGGINLGADLASGLSAFGNSVPIVTADRLGGSGPNQITVDGAAPTLAEGLRLSYIPSAGTVNVESSVKLTIDRLTGAMSMTNGGGALDLKGYSIASPNAFFDRRPANFLTFEDTDVPGWAEASLTPSLLSEFNIGGSTVLNAGQVVDFGTPVVAGVGSKPVKESITMEYLTADGRILPGIVEYVGPVADIVLSIDPETGNGMIDHSSPVVGEFDIAGFTIASASGSLDESGYAGLGWDVSPNNSDSIITEFNLTDSMVFSTGVSADLGKLFDVGGTQDVSFRYSLANGIQGSGSVVYGLPEVGPTCSPANELLGDLDGNGTVAFADFLVLSGNFGNAVGTYAEGDVDCDGTVAFADFLSLSGNFGKSLGGAAAVPEPSSAVLLFLGFLGMMKFRKRARHIAVATAVVTMMGVSAQDSHAQFSGRYLRIHPEASNGGIDNVREFQSILAGEQTGVIINEDFEFETELIDFGGGDGGFTGVQEPYPDGPNGEVDLDTNTFGMVLSANVTIPAGEFAIACGSDDGCWVRIDGVAFEETFNENGPTVDGDGEILFNAGRGHAFTTGNFTLDAELETTMEVGFFENGGGDSFEVAVWDSYFIDGTDVWSLDDPNGIGEELGDGIAGWSITPGAYTGPGNPNPADVNIDGAVDTIDAQIIERNFGRTNAGDANGDGQTDLADVWILSQALAAQAGPPSESVPEPTGLLMSFFALIGLLGSRRRRR